MFLSFKSCTLIAEVPVFQIGSTGDDTFIAEEIEDHIQYVASDSESVTLAYRYNAQDVLLACYEHHEVLIFVR
jgi:hypothetical protein